MSIKITSLRTDARLSESLHFDNVPFLILNLTFKIEDEDDLFQMAKAESEDYTKVLTIDNPKKYTDWILQTDMSFDLQYPGYGRAWIPNDPPWVYIEKFNTFRLRDYIADCPVTRAILEDIKYYKEHGKLPTIYRHTDECIILNHFRTLSKYWD